MQIVMLLLLCSLSQTAQSKPASATPPVMRADPKVAAPAPPSQKPESQAQEVGEGDVISVDTAVVNVPVSVLQHDGKYVADLRKEDFRLWEDGVEQQITYFAPVENPFTVVLMLDISDSTEQRLPAIQQAAFAFVEQLRVDDRVLVVSFDSRINILSEATRDRGVLRKAILSTLPGKGTRLYDAVDFVVNHRLNRVFGRKAIVVFTDGVDTFSRATALGTVRDLEEQDVLVYPVRFDTESDTREREGNSPTVLVYTSGDVSRHKTYVQAGIYLNLLADRTGGHLYNAGGRQSIAQAFAMVAEALRWQYSLGYYPQPAGEPGQRHKVKVRVNRTHVAVRAKDSYIRRPAPETKRQQ